MLLATSNPWWRTSWNRSKAWKISSWNRQWQFLEESRVKQHWMFDRPTTPKTWIFFEVCAAKVNDQKHSGWCTEKASVQTFSLASVTSKSWLDKGSTEIFHKNSLDSSKICKWWQHKAAKGAFFKFVAPRNLLISDPFPTRVSKESVHWGELKSAVWLEILSLSWCGSSHCGSVRKVNRFHLPATAHSLSFWVSCGVTLQIWGHFTDLNTFFTFEFVTFPLLNLQILGNN